LDERQGFLNKRDLSKDIFFLSFFGGPGNLKKISKESLDVKIRKTPEQRAESSKKLKCLFSRKNIATPPLFK